MTPEDQNAIRVNILQYKLASMAQAGCIFAGLIAAIWYGFPSIFAGLIGGWLFHNAKPGPSERLDRATGRGN